MSNGIEEGVVDRALNDGRAEANILSNVVSALQDLDVQARQRILRAVLTFYGIDFAGGSQQKQSEAARIGLPTSFSEDRTISPKEFMLQKSPRTDIERVACLAYYLTHYRSTPHFKTLDISKLNTEAAQLKFSNAAVAVDNATRNGLLVPSTKGNKQISTYGERYVVVLPDREAAKAELADGRLKRKTRKNSTANSKE
jgi:hypothetical protein